MTTYYSYQIRSRIVESAEKKLLRMRGKMVTQKQLYEMFGPYDAGRPSCDENRDAFRDMIERGLLLEVAPGKYSVSTADVDRKVKSRLEAGQKLIAECVQETAKKIQEVVMEWVRGVEDCFPKILFAVKCKKAAGRAGEPNREEKEMPGVVLRHFHNNNIDNSIILTPEGIWDCPHSRVEGVVDEIPDWDSKRAFPELWIQYGAMAMRELFKYC